MDWLVHVGMGRAIGLSRLRVAVSVIAGGISQCLWKGILGWYFRGREWNIKKTAAAAVAAMTKYN
jgi:hypothetical protein